MRASFTYDQFSQIVRAVGEVNFELEIWRNSGAVLFDDQYKRLENERIKLAMLVEDFVNAMMVKSTVI
jgi:hypothetical protein